MTTHLASDFRTQAPAIDGDGPLPGETFAECCARQEAEAEADLARQMALLDTNDFADLHEVLDLLLTLVEGDCDDDPRVVAGIQTLARLMGHTRRPPVRRD